MQVDSATLELLARRFRVVSWMPDTAPGATPILVGDLEALYMVVTRRATTMQTDPYSAGFCSQFKFSAHRRQCDMSERWQAASYQLSFPFDALLPPEAPGIGALPHVGVPSPRVGRLKVRND
jgi:hypothetical protein